MTLKTIFTQTPHALAANPTAYLHPDCPIDMLRKWCETLWDDQEIVWVLSEPVNANAVLYFAEPIYAAITYATWYQYILRVE